MNTSKLVLALIPILALAACATTKEWAAAGGDREAGIVKVSYQYPEYQQPSMSDAQAEQIAENRCNVWGFAHADYIPGQVRECSDMDGGNCTVWKVTREYQCSGDAKMAHRSGDDSLSTRLAPFRASR